jgi:crossover junction endodeoxyribonuclease RuvC
MIVYGIDPGLSGAIALYRPSDGWLEVHDMPTLTAAKGKTELNHHRILDIMQREGDEQQMCMLERVGARPGQGVTSMFNFGRSYGSLEMAIAAAEMPMQYVTPAVWKRFFGLGACKDAARGVAIQRFPAMAGAFARKKDDGRAEAALIALYGWEARK